MLKKSIIAAALAIAASGAFAQVYVQGSVGNGNTNYSCGTNACQKSSAGNKFLAGYGLGNGWNVEGQIISYGKVTSPSFQDVKTTGWGANAAYIGDFNENFGFRAALGLGFNKGVDPTGNASTTSTQLTAGAGIAYNFNKSVALTVDYDISNGKISYANGSNATGGLSLLSVGIRAKF